MGADEYHPHLSPLFDNSVKSNAVPSDGGGAFLLRKTDKEFGLRISPLFFENSEQNPAAVKSLLAALGGPEAVRSKYGALFAGKPLAQRATCEMQIDEFVAVSGFTGPVIDFRKFTGEFGSATAAAAALAARLVEDGHIAPSLSGGVDFHLDGKGILLLGLGAFITAVEILA
jgi:3-oxoacyl-[acyl-carrier-protein] synthase-1/3-oxoacyl-[acyl-carrier-protein] synthase II